MHNNVFNFFWHTCRFIPIWAISIASKNAGVSVHFCMIWGRRNTAVKRLPVTRTNSLRLHSRSKYRAMTSPGVRDRGRG